MKCYYTLHVYTKKLKIIKLISPFAKFTKLKNTCMVHYYRCNMCIYYIVCIFHFSYSCGYYLTIACQVLFIIFSNFYRICDAIGARVAYDIFQMALPGIGHLVFILVIEAVVFTALVFRIEVGACT